MFMNVH